jgi:hypothetical protein
MDRRGSIAAGIALGVLLVVAGLAPLILTTLPAPVPVKVVDPATQVDGVYVGTDSAVYHIFPYPEPSPDFPADAFATTPAARVWVKYGGLSDLADYAIRSYPAGAEVPSDKVTAAPRLLELRPVSELAPGEYYAEVARESLLGGSDYVYFSVETSAARATTSP